MKVAAHGYISCMQVRPGCAFVLEWNLPFRNPGSATDQGCILWITNQTTSCDKALGMIFQGNILHIRVRQCLLAILVSKYQTGAASSIIPCIIITQTYLK